jgi:hypothetical protein
MAKAAADATATMSHFQAELAKARVVMAVARVDLVAAPAANAVIHAVTDEDDNDDMDPQRRGGEAVSAEQRTLLASFKILPENASRRQAIEAEGQARGIALDMRQAYLHSDMVAVMRFEI